MKLVLKLFLLLFINTLFSQQAEYEIINTSINSKYAELGVKYLNNNTVLFASSKKLENDKPFTKSRRVHNRELYLELFKGSIDENGDIINVSRFTNEKFNKFFESDICFTPDFKKIYFTWNNYFSIQTEKSQSKDQTLYLFSASIDENYSITNIEPLRFNSKSYSLRSPVVSKDGKRLYLSSNMPNGYGGYDIYVADIYENGSHSFPKNLGPNINTKEDEFFPFIDVSNSLYFSSNGHRGKGGLDIFKSEFKNNEYQLAESLPAPINSEFNDFWLVLNNHDKAGYLTSDRENGKGNVDIYAFKEKEAECDETITGMFLNKITNKKLKNVQLKIFDNKQNITNVNLNNSYKFSLKCNKTYKIIAEKENFETSEITIKTTNINKREFSKDINLTPLKCNQFVTGVILNKETSTPLANAIVNLFNKDSLISQLALDSNAKFNFKIPCNSEYLITASLGDFLDNKKTIISTGEYNMTNNAIIHLKPNTEFVIVREKKMIKTNPIYFDLNSVAIRLDASVELNKVITIMNKYPTIKIEIQSHTDSRAPDSYNITLSNKRAESTVSYLISKGIDPNRIVGNGYGETQLINKCSNGVKCTEVQHQRNRRTEFVIINE